MSKGPTFSPALRSDRSSNFLSACAERCIPNTDVVDTDDNREIVGFCETYRRAVERKDATALLGMVSPDYYEDGGNADASDDMDYAQFKAFLLGQGPMPAEGAPGSAAIAFVDAAAIRHEIRYRRVLREHERVFVDYTYRTQNPRSKEVRVRVPPRPQGQQHRGLATWVVLDSATAHSRTQARAGAWS